MYIWIIFTFNDMFMLNLKRSVGGNLMMEIKHLKFDVVLS